MKPFTPTKKPLRKRSPKSAVKVAPRLNPPRTDAEARALAIKNGWGAFLKRFPAMGKA